MFWGLKSEKRKIIQDEWSNITSYASRKYNRLYVEKSANGLLEMTLSTRMVSGIIHMLEVRLVTKNSTE